MKYLLLVLLVSCGARESNVDRLARQADEFCSCQGGLLNYYIVDDKHFGELEVYCNDGTKLIAKLVNTEKVNIGTGKICNEK